MVPSPCPESVSVKVPGMALVMPPALAMTKLLTFARAPPAAGVTDGSMTMFEAMVASAASATAPVMRLVPLSLMSAPLSRTFASLGIVAPGPLTVKASP